MVSNDMPPVKLCDVLQCFYNKEQQCNAPAINVGGSHPTCDTFLESANHIARDGQSMVGACHVSQCRYNQDLLCRADSIHVALHTNHADCVTYEPRQ